MKALRTVRDLHRTYSNWPHLGFALLGRAQVPGSVVLRDGVDLGPPARRGTLFALARGRSAGWLVRGGPPGHVLLGPRPGVSLLARWSTGFDVENAGEVYLDRVYAADVRGKRVIDVGASIGDSSLCFAADGAQDVLAIEPNAETFALLERNVAASEVGRSVRLLHAAAGSADGSAELRMPTGVPNAASVSPGPAALERWRFDRSTRVVVRSLGALILESAPTRIGLLKIDAQGAEYGLLEGLGPEALSRVDEIILEFTDGRRGLPALLEKAGYSVVATGASRGYLRARRPVGSDLPAPT